MQQRYYDPVAGRFLSVDPVVTNANTGGSFSRYNYANNNPYKYVDRDGRDITCAANTCTLTPIGGGLPIIAFPRPDGFPSKISNADSIFHHVYRFESQAGKGDADFEKRLGAELVKSPTPMANRPATNDGNRIDVNADNAISPFTGKDMVLSYKVGLQNGGAAILNVTTGDHAATWGIVFRVVQSGSGGAKIVTYGEGDSALQRIFDPKNNQSRDTWNKSSQEIIERAK